MATKKLLIVMTIDVEDDADAQHHAVKDGEDHVLGVNDVDGVTVAEPIITSFVSRQTEKALQGANMYISVTDAQVVSAHWVEG